MKAWKIYLKCMKKEKEKNKICIIGHTKGIGKAIADISKFEVVGLSRSNGYDLSGNLQNIMDKIDECEYIVINAYAKSYQLELLKRIYKKYENENKKVAVITSTSGTSAGEDDNVSNGLYKEYCRHKKELIKYIEDIQQELIKKPLSIFDICPDVVDTEMTEGMWEHWPKLEAKSVAEAVWYCFETQSKFNINKIVLQKNAI